MKAGKFMCMLLAVTFLTSCVGQEKQEVKSETKEEQSEEKGYDLAVDEMAKKQGEKELKSLIKAGSQDQQKLWQETRKNGDPCVLADQAANMENSEKADDFLKNASGGQEGELCVYQIKGDGRVIRNLFVYDGEEMFLLYMSARQEDDGRIIMGETSYTKIKQWRYTDKGWFVYELCVPEWPKVTEVVQSIAMMCIRHVEERYLEIENNYLRPVGYQGNNLFLAQWGAGEMENLDYVGIFDSFYRMIYQKNVDNQEFADGIPQETFETVIQTFLAVSTEELRESRYYRKESGTYLWQAYGVGTHFDSEVANAIPKVVDMKEQEDGTCTLMIESVNEITGEDCVFSHELTVRFLQDGGMIYLGNHLTGRGKYQEPGYQYRVGE